MTGKVRVGFINSTSEVGGADMDLLRTVRTLDRALWEPVVVLPSEGPLVGAFREAGAQVLFSPVFPIKRVGGARRWARQALEGVGGIGLLARRFRTWRLDLVHVNSTVLPTAEIAAKVARLPLVGHARELASEPRWAGRALCIVAALTADRIVAISDAVAAQFPLWARPRVRVVRHGVDLDRFDPKRVGGAEIRAELGLGPEAPVVGFLGRLVPWKGADRFLEACATVAAECPEARFVVAGSVMAGHEGYARAVEELASRPALAGRVGFLYGRTDVPEILAALDVFVHASVRPEPFGLVIIEAMAMGRAVVASGAGGVPETIEGPATGRLVAPGDVDGMARAVLGLLGDPEERRRMGLAARQKAVREFDVRMATKSLEQIYRSVLGCGDNPSAQVKGSV